MNLRSQLLKGILEGCILAIIKQESTYGYGLSVKLHELGLTNIGEGINLSNSFTFAKGTFN